MKNNQKRHLARAMMTDTEVRMGVNPYDSRAWRQRKKSRQLRHERKQAAAHARAAARKGAARV